MQQYQQLDMLWFFLLPDNEFASVVVIWKLILAMLFVPFLKGFAPAMAVNAMIGLVCPGNEMNWHHRILKRRRASKYRSYATPFGYRTPWIATAWLFRRKYLR